MFSYGLSSLASMLPPSQTITRALSGASDTVTETVSALASTTATAAKSGMGMAASGVKAASSFVGAMYDSSCAATPTFHFGKPIGDCVLEDVAGYEAPLPSILLWLHEWFKGANGMAQKGIFRTSANAVTVERLKKILCASPDLSQVQLEPKMATDAPLFASMIKIWLRELPTGLLNGIDPSRLQMLELRDVSATVSAMRAHERAVLLWTLDLFAEAVRAEERTLMTRKAAAILLGPNLFRMEPDTDPGVQLLQIKLVTTFIESALLWRMGSVF